MVTFTVEEVIQKMKEPLLKAGFNERYADDLARTGAIGLIMEMCSFGLEKEAGK